MKLQKQWNFFLITFHLYSEYVCVSFTVKEMKQKRRGSILETVVPRRFTTSSTSSPKSPHRMNLTKPPVALKDSALSGPPESTPTASPKLPHVSGVSESTPTASPKLPHKEDDSSDQNKEPKWSTSDLPSLQLHNKDFPALVGMLEQVSCSCRYTYGSIPVVSNVLLFAFFTK